MHEASSRARSSASDGHAPRGGTEVEEHDPDEEAEDRDDQAVDEHRDAAAEEHRGRFAGEASSGPSVPNCRSLATAIVIPYTAAIAQTCTAFPTMKNASLSPVSA